MNGDQTSNDHLAALRMPAPSGTSMARNRSNAEVSSAHFYFGPFRLELTERKLFRDGAPVQIGGRAFDLLAVLTRRAGEVIGSRELLKLVWPHAVVEEANLRVCIATLRKALGENRLQPRFIMNVAGRGYTFAGTITCSTPMNSGAFEDRSAAGTHRQWRPLQVLVSCDSAPEILLRLLSSPRFARTTGGGIGEGHLSTATRHAAALGAERDDAASCFVVLDEPVGTGSNPAVEPSDTFRARLHRDPGRPADTPPTGKDIVVFLDRCRRPAEMALYLVEGPLRGAASVHFLTTNRDALRFEREYLPALAPYAEIRATMYLVEVLKTIGVTSMAYSQWEQKYGGLMGEGMQRLHELEKENERLRKAVSDLTLEKVILEENALTIF